MDQINKKTLSGLPIWYFPSNLNNKGERLIDNHIKSSDLTVQVHGTDNTSNDIYNAIQETCKINKLSPKYVHVYPAKENTITVYMEKSDKKHKICK